MARPSWQGFLKLSLVTCPVVLYNAVSPGSEVRFNLINPDTGNRVRTITVDGVTEQPVPRTDLVKGFEVEKGAYVTVTADDLNSVKLDSTRTIDIDRFVPATEIDRIYWDHPYYLFPDGQAAQEPFTVILAAMREAKKVGIGRVVLSSRERIMALEPKGGAITATTLRSFAEVREIGSFGHPPIDDAADQDMVAIATRIIDQKSTGFDPTTFEDRYETALRALIEDKKRGMRTIRPDQPTPAVLNLMEALRASLRPPGDDRPHGRVRAAAEQASSPRAVAPKKRPGRRKSST